MYDIQEILNIYFIKYYNQLESFIDYLIINKVDTHLINEVVTIIKG